MTTLCPACETGALISRIGDRVIHFEGNPLRVENLQYSECPACGEQVVLPAQSKRNELTYADAKKARLGLWTGGKIEAFRKEWCITQIVASRIFGGGPNAFSKYERGEVIHSKSMDLLMRVFSESEEAREFLTEAAGVRLESMPAWQTMKRSRAPRGLGSLNTIALLRATAVNEDHWQTCEVANG